MYIQPNTIYLILAIMAVFWLVVVTVLSIYFALSDKSDQKISKGFEHLRRDLESRSVEIMEDARKKSEAIVDKAVFSAEAIESDAQRILSDNHTSFKDELTKLSKKQLETLDKTSHEFIKEYKDAVNSEKANIVKSFHQLTEDVRSTLLIDFDKFKADVDARTLQAQKEIDAKVTESYSKMLSDLEEYKKVKLAKLDNDTLRVLENVATKTFGKVLSLQDHKDFVLKNLEDAKKEFGLK